MGRVHSLSEQQHFLHALSNQGLQEKKYGGCLKSSLTSSSDVASDSVGSLSLTRDIELAIIVGKT
eukprot:m.160396 g.160396  ORF g.160396 m.160396 type:complete len:65 (+) comp14554_c0_seq3:47-241(+)